MEVGLTVDFNKLDPTSLTGEIDIEYHCIKPNGSIVLIGQRDFSGARRSENCGNDSTCSVLVCGAHLHHSDKVHFECEVTHSERLPCVDKARSVMSRAHRTLVACCEPASSN
jgi:hypothetical protein